MEQLSDLSAPLIKAIGLIGGPSAAANHLRRRGFQKMSPSHIRNWIKRDKKTPAEVCRHLEAIIDELGKERVTRYELRPDVFGDEPPSPIPQLLDQLSGVLTVEEHRELLAMADRGPAELDAYIRGLSQKYKTIVDEAFISSRRSSDGGASA
jgi:DNA-binding transcriptional regulator YdaS (Cro superfamily)